MKNSAKNNHKSPGVLMFFLIAVISLTNCVTGSDSTTNGNGNGTLTKEYKKEGFITNNKFRIVIVVPAENEQDKTAIEKTAKNRAFMSLQKYLRSRNITINQNIRANIINVINQHGSIIEASAHSKTRKVYFFDIKKDNLRHYIDSSSTQR